MNKMERRPTLRIPTSNDGFSVVELLVVGCMMGILAMVAISNLKVAENPLANAAVGTERLFHLARARAVSSTQAIIVAPSTNSTIITSSSDSCDGTLTAIPDLHFELPHGSSLAETGWSICFNQRGLAAENVSVVLLDSESNQRTVRVALGGGTKVD